MTIIITEKTSLELRKKRFFMHIYFNQCNELLAQCSYRVGLLNYLDSPFFCLAVIGINRFGIFFISMGI